MSAAEKMARGGACHKCRFAASVQRGDYEGMEWERTPCAACMEENGDRVVDSLEQGHGRVVSYNDAAIHSRTEPETDAVETGGGLAEAVSAAVYSVATLTLGEVVSVWNHLRGGSLSDAGSILGVTRQRCNALLHSGLARLGVADVWTADSPARRKLFAIRRLAGQVTRRREKKPSPGLSESVRGRKAQRRAT